jgi:hypothetical protein
MAGSSLGELSLQEYFGFADILALPGEKTIHECGKSRLVCIEECQAQVGNLRG